MERENLIRAVGVQGLSAAIVNYTVGAGIFVLPAVVAARIGGAAPVAYIICALVMGLIVTCFAEAGSRVSMSGGTYAYAETVFGPYIGFLVAIMLWFSVVLASASVANVFFDALSRFAPVLEHGLVRSIALLALYAALAAVNIRGVRSGSGVVQGAAVGKLTPLLILIVAGFLALNSANLAWPGFPSIENIGRSTSLLIFAFMGVETALAPSGEVYNPARTVPRSILIAFIVVTLLYLSIQVVTQGVLGADLALNTKAPLAETASRVLGRSGEILIVLATAISTFGATAGDMLAAPRVIYSLGRDRLIPSVVGAVHPTFRTPYVAIAFHASCCAFFAITGTFETLAPVSVLATLFVYFVCVLATIQLRRRDIRSDGSLPFRAPGGPVVPILAALVVIWLMTTATRQEFYAAGAMLIFSSLLFLVMRLLQPSPRSN
ncbi:MAG TPA: APC family permease [Gemmatimonadaceae bacterium]